MNNPSRPSSPNSHANLVKEAKEALKQEGNHIKEVAQTECGIDNPCVFGAPNKNFDKNNIIDNKRTV